MFTSLTIAESFFAPFPSVRTMLRQGPGRRSILNDKNRPSKGAARFAHYSLRAGTVTNPNRRLPRKQMLAARRLEQLGRGVK